MLSSNEWVRVKEKAQITIPYKICKELDIKKGDLFQVEIVGAKIEFTPKVLIDKT